MSIQREIEVAKQEYREGWGDAPERIFIPENRLDELKSVDNRAFRTSVDKAHVYLMDMRLCIGGDKIIARAREIPEFNYMDTRNE